MEFKKEAKEIIKGGLDGFVYADLRFDGYKTIGEAIRNIQKYKLTNWVIVMNSKGLYDICPKEA